jgi:hypothetical protein
LVKSLIVIVDVLGVDITTLSSPQLSVLAEVHFGIIHLNCVLAVCAAAGIGTTILLHFLTSYPHPK